MGGVYIFTQLMESYCSIVTKHKILNNACRINEVHRQVHAKKHIQSAIFAFAGIHTLITQYKEIKL